MIHAVLKAKVHLCYYAICLEPEEDESTESEEEEEQILHTDEGREAFVPFAVRLPHACETHRRELRMYIEHVLLTEPSISSFFPAKQRDNMIAALDAALPIVLHKGRYPFASFVCTVASTLTRIYVLQKMQLVRNTLQCPHCDNECQLHERPAEGKRNVTFRFKCSSNAYTECRSLSKALMDESWFSKTDDGLRIMDLSTSKAKKFPAQDS